MSRYCASRVRRARAKMCSLTGYSIRAPVYSANRAKLGFYTIQKFFF